MQFRKVKHDENVNRGKSRMVTLNEMRRSWNKWKLFKISVIEALTNNPSMSGSSS